MSFKQRGCWYWLVPIVVMALLTACSKSAPQLKVRIGAPFPDLQVTDLKNNAITITAASGKLTILNLWATWCGPCRQEMPSLDRLAGLLGEDDFRVLGLSVDHDEYVVREFLIERKIFFENYLDKSSRNANQLIGVRMFPSTFFIDPDGRLLKVEEGWKYWDAPEVMEEIKSLLATFKSNSPSLGSTS